MTAKLSSCVKAATTLNDQDLSALTDAIEAYQRAGVSPKQAEALAVDDLIAAVTAERKEMVAALREQHPDAFESDKPAPTAAQRAKARMAFNPETDSVLQAIAKMGGLRRDVAASEFGLKPEELKHTVATGGLKGYPFRATGGMDLDRVLTNLQEAGYFPGVADEDARGALEAAIFDELGGGKNLTVEGQMRAAQEAVAEKLDADEAAEREALLADAEMLDDIPALTDDDVDFFATSNTSTEAAMRALGFSEEEIRNETAREAAPAGAPEDGQAAAEEASAPGRARSEGAGSAGAGSDGFELAGQSADDLKAKTAREANADALDERSQIDAERDMFGLQQQTGEQRSDSTSDLFGGPTADDVRRAAKPKGKAPTGPDLFAQPDETTPSVQPPSGLDVSNADERAAIESPDDWDTTKAPPTDAEILAAGKIVKPGLFLQTNYGFMKAGEVIAVTSEPAKDGEDAITQVRIRNMRRPRKENDSFANVFLRDGKLYEVQKNEFGRGTGHDRVYVLDKALPTPDPEAQRDWENATPDELGDEISRLHNEANRLMKAQLSMERDSDERAETIARADDLKRQADKLNKLLPDEETTETAADETDEPFEPPTNWRESMYGARVYAKELGIDPAGMELPALVKAIDKKIKPARQAVDKQLAASDLPAYLRERIPQVLADFQGKLTIDRLLGNLGDPNKPGELISGLAAGKVIDELVENGTLVRKFKSIMLPTADSTDAPRVKNAEGREYREGDSVSVHYDEKSAEYPRGFERTGKITKIEGEKVTFKPNGAKEIVIGPDRLRANLSETLDRGGPPREATPGIVEHVTAKGKTLRGVIRNDLTLEQAKAIDQYTFKKDGGYFIREQHLAEAPPVGEPIAAPAPRAAAEPAPPPPPSGAKLRAVGEKMIEEGDEALGRDRNTNTARRVSMAASAEAKASLTKYLGQKMVRLADAIEAGEAKALAGITQRAQIEVLESVRKMAMHNADKAANKSYATTEREKGRPFEPNDLNGVEYPRPSTWMDGARSKALEMLKGKRGSKELQDRIRYSSGPDAEILAGMKKVLGDDVTKNIVGWHAPEMAARAERLKRAGINDLATLREAIREYNDLSATRAKIDPAKELERKLVGSKGVGIDFFPTPKATAERMVEEADIQPGMRVLEPSAGNGNIAEAIRAAGVEPDTAELSSALREILEAKKFKLVGRDFMELKDGGYDRILMNPPFGGGADMDHVRHAYTLLKPGGRIVAIMGEGGFFRSDKKATEFRAWLEESGGTDEKLPAGTFMDTKLLATTGTNGRMVVIDKPGGESMDLQNADELAKPEVIEGGAAQADIDAVAKIEAESRKTDTFKSLQLTALPRLSKPGKGASDAEQLRYAAADLSEKLYGQRLVYFHANMPFANGMQADYVPGVVFMNEATTRPVMALLGHELTHTLRATHPALYERLSDRIDALLTAEGKDNSGLNLKRKARGMLPLPDSRLREERNADIVGDFFTEPAFWREVAAGQPSLFARVLRVIRDFLDDLLAKLRKERPFGTDRYLTDVEAARTAVADAMREFANSPKTAAAAVTAAAEANASENNDPFYSELGRQVATAKMGAAPAQGWKDWFKGLVSKGTIKADELAWTGVEDWLDLQSGKVTRDAIVNYLDSNGIKVSETRLGVTDDSGVDLMNGDTPDVRWVNEETDGDLTTYELTVEGEPYTITHDAAMGSYTVQGPGGEFVDGEATALLDAQQMAEKHFVDKFDKAAKDAGFDGPTKYSTYTLPGGSNYREVLLTLPRITGKQALGRKAVFDKYQPAIDDVRKREDAAMRGGESDPMVLRQFVIEHENLMAKRDREAAAAAGEVTDYETTHWDQKNILAHIRLNDRTDADGKRVLFVEEIQSDWAQEGKKKGFAPQVDAELRRISARMEAIQDRFNESPESVDERKALVDEKRELTQRYAELSRGGVPPAPFVGKTDAWVALAIKRVIKMAVDEGYDRVAFVNGEQSANRYKLSKQVDEVSWNTTKAGNKHVKLTLPNSNPLMFGVVDGVITEATGPGFSNFKGKPLDDVIGKDLTKKIMEADDGKLAGAGLDVGGEGMKAFYDQIVPKVAKNVVRKLGADGLSTSDIMVKAGANDEPMDFRHARDIPKPQLGFDITPTMREKAAGGLPMFSLQYTPEEEEALRKAGINTRTRLQRAGDRIRTYYGNAQNAVRSSWARQFQQGALDQFTGLNLAVRREIGALPVDQDPYVAARLANGGTSGVMRGLMLHGQAKWAANGQHLEKIPGTEGLLDILKPLGPHLNDFFGWMIGNRAERLMKEGRENNFTPEDIKALQGLNKGHEAEFRTAALAYAQFKRSVLDIAEQAGLLDPEARAVWDSADYIPFYREIDDKAVFSATGKKGLSGQSSGIRTLKGGEAGLNDPMENILMNFSRLIDASLKNSALAKTIDVLNKAGSDVVHKVGYDMNKQVVPAAQVRKLLEAAGTPDQVLDIIPPEAFDGMAKMWAIQAPTDPDVVRIMVNGKPQFYKVNDPLLLKSLTSFVPFDFPGLGVARAFKRVLTGMVTATPEFMVRNFIRDTAASAIITRDGFHPGKSLTGIVKSYRESGAFEDLLFAGASFQSGNINAADPVQTGKAMRRALREKGFDASSANAFMASILDTPAKFWEKYRHVGESIENANREAVYEAAIKSNKGATAAAYESKDLMDFSLRGSSPVYQLLADVLPFFNARVQGLYRLGRTSPSRLITYGMLMTMASLALAYANGDNDDYDKLPDWDKETYWHFWIKGEHFRIPKPFELGAVFASVPERILRYAMGQDTGKKTLSRLWAIIRDQLAFDPVPQIVRPVLNTWANKDTFRDRPIENQGDEGKLPSQRFSKITSPTAVAATQAIAPVADEIGLSPKKLEYLVGGYLGTAGLYALGLSDMAVRKFNNEPPRPALRADELPLVRAFYRQEPAVSTVYETDLYKMRTEIDQVYKSVRALRKDDKEEAADALEAKNEKLLEARKVVERGAKKLAKLNRERDAIYNDRTMTPQEKRKAIDELLVERAEVSKETMKSEAVVNAQ